MLICSKCKILKEISCFFKNKSRKNGLDFYCKTCRYEVSKPYIAKANIDIKKKVRQQKWLANGGKEKLAQHLKRKKEIDPLYKLKQNLRTAISAKIKNANYKKDKKTEQILGCNWIVLKKHLEENFTDGMTWDNYGQWHIDHKIPIAFAKTEQEVYQLNHYLNLQPLWAKDNLKKGSKLIYLT